MRVFKPAKTAPTMIDVRNTYAMLVLVIRSVGEIWNIAAPVAMVRLPIEMTLHNPQPTNSDCIRIRSVSPVGILVKITNKIVPVTIG